MSLPVAQLAWMGGVLDLKGKIIFKKNRQRATPQIVLMVESKFDEVIRKLSQMTGTAPEKMKTPIPTAFNRRPCSEHCPDQHSHVSEQETSWPAIARWTVTGLAAAVVLSNVRPFMATDRGFEDLITEIFDQAAFSGQGAGMTVKAIRRLESLGWDIPDIVLQQIAQPLAIEAAPEEKRIAA